MNTPATLSNADQATYESIFRHPVSHNLEWTELFSLLNHLGDLEEESNGKMKFSRQGQTLTIHSHGKDVDVEEIMRLRHFLLSSEAAAKAESGSGDRLVVLNHAGALVFGLGSQETEPLHVVPVDPSGHDHQVHNPVGDSGGKQGPYRKLFYDYLAKKLEGAERIVILGDGQGASSETDRFVTYLREHRHGDTTQHHADISERIVATKVANISHLSHAELVAKARTHLGHSSQG